MLLYREIRAACDRDTIIVYQAFHQEIAFRAVEHQKFVHPFSFHRRTWVKPSFLWMMAGSGWGQKQNQECILAVHIGRMDFEQALKEAVLSERDRSVYEDETYLLA